MRALLICNHGPRCESLNAQMDEAGFEVHSVGTLDEGFCELENRSYGAVLLDADGVEGDVHKAVYRMRGEDFDEPVIVFGLDGEDPKTIACLDAGADDVTPAEMDAEELLARVRACIRRCTPLCAEKYELADLKVDLKSHAVERGGRSIHLTPRELAVLERLFLRVRAVVPRQELANHVWDRDVDPGSNLLDTYIARLRRKLDRNHDLKLLHTVKGRGYMLTDVPPAEIEEPVGA